MFDLWLLYSIIHCITPRPFRLHAFVLNISSPQSLPDENVMPAVKRFLCHNNADKFYCSRRVSVSKISSISNTVPIPIKKFTNLILEHHAQLLEKDEHGLVIWRVKNREKLNTRINYNVKQMKRCSTRNNESTKSEVYLSIQASSLYVLVKNAVCEWKIKWLFDWILKPVAQKKKKDGNFFADLNFISSAQLYQQYIIYLLLQTEFVNSKN